MTNISSTPSPARTDVRLTQDNDRAAITATRRAGLALALGAFTWSMASFAVGFSPSSETGIKIQDLAGLAFQAGVMALLHVQMRTRATGPRPISRRLLQVERVLLVLAMAWTVTHAFLPGQRESVWMGVLDVFWPLSMLGMFLIGVKVAIAGVWRGPGRYWALVAETWGPVTVPTFVLAGHAVGDTVGAAHLLVGYTCLGVILATRPDLVERRD